MPILSYLAMLSFVGHSTSSILESAIPAIYSSDYSIAVLLLFTSSYDIFAVTVTTVPLSRIFLNLPLSTPQYLFTVNFPISSQFIPIVFFIPSSTQPWNSLSTHHILIYYNTIYHLFLPPIPAILHPPPQRAWTHLVSLLPAYRFPSVIQSSCFQYLFVHT